MSNIVDSNIVDSLVIAQFKDEGGAFFPVTPAQRDALNHKAYIVDEETGRSRLPREWVVDGDRLIALNDSAMLDAAEELEDAALILDDIAYENGLSLPTAKAESLRRLAYELRVSAREWEEGSE